MVIKQRVMIPRSKASRVRHEVPRVKKERSDETDI